MVLFDIMPQYPFESVWKNPKCNIFFVNRMKKQSIFYKKLIFILNIVEIRKFYFTFQIFMIIYT